MEFSSFPQKGGLRHYGLFIRSLTLALILSSQIFLSNCERDFSAFQPVQKDDPGWVKLSIKKIGVREVWLNLSVKNPGDEIWVYRDALKIFEGNVKVKDSTLYDFNLLPEHNYSYIAYLIRNNAKEDSSSRVLLTTRPQWNRIGLADTFAVRLKISDPYLYVCSGPYGLWRTDILDPEFNWKHLGFDNYNPGSTWLSGVQDILVSSDDHDKLLVGRRGSGHTVFRSLDGGENWTAADSGLVWVDGNDSGYASIRGFVECPGHILAAGRGIYISYNFGEHWEQTEDIGGIEALQRHPVSSDIVWCGGSDDIDDPFLLSSINSGVDWNLISHIMPYPSTVWSIEFDPVDAATVYVGGGGLIKTMDGGQSWTHLFGGIVHEVWVDPEIRNHLWIVVGSSEIYETWDGGLAWKPVENPIPTGTYIWDIIRDENSETLLLATTSGVYSYTP